MDLPIHIYQQQKINADKLRKRLSYPILHDHNLPAQVDLRRWMTEIEDQGDIGSCVANTIAGALEYLYRRSAGKVIDVSRLFIDFNARIANLDWHNKRNFVIRAGDPDNDFETNRQAALRALQQYGFCKESLWPYDPQLYQKVPPQHVYDEASKVSVNLLRVPINISSIKTCLAYQIPVLVGILLSSDDAYNNRGYVKIPRKPPNEGYHACLVVGYNDRNRHFIIRNSWGVEWGDKGYCYVPYEYLINKDLVVTTDAFWAIPEIVPRSKRRKGYYNYPNFTLYNQRTMLSLPKTHLREQQLHDQRRRRKPQRVRHY